MTAPDYPCIIAHRCGGALAPENSLAGLAISARLGCRGVEFDVMLSGDGIPLLMHDETLERTTTGHGRVAELPLATIRSHDAGVRHHPAYAASPAPSFAEAMALCAELGLWTNIEIKPATGHDAITGATVAEWLARHWSGRGVVSSFSVAALAEVRQRAPTVACALLVEQLPNYWREMLAALDAHALHLDASQVSAATAAALSNIPWACYTVNQRAEASRLFALGCRAVFTDRPDLWQADEM